MEWEKEIPLDYPDRESLLASIRHGFNVIDNIDFTNSPPVEVKNYPSASHANIAQRVQSQIQFEIEHGHYKRVDYKPAIVSALGDIPKKNSSKVRLIHDCSRPSGNAVNDRITPDKFCYETLQDAVDYVTPGCYLAKVDLAHAYRLVCVHPSNWPALGLKYRFPLEPHPSYMVDTRLPFGSPAAPSIFNKLTQLVRTILKKNYGIDGVVAYLDDFLIIARTKDECMQKLNTLMRLLGRLGFWINYNKI